MMVARLQKASEEARGALDVGQSPLERANETGMLERTK